MNSRGVKRISDITQLRNRQFPEDASPMAHPIKPPSYIEINNFYTPTVYEKGAEVIRMIETLIGKDNFKKGMKKYFELYDGQAVTTEDFVHSMELASGFDLSHFKRWYHQAGTPVLNVHENYDEKNKTYTLDVEQTCPATPESQNKDPFHMPLKLALFHSNGTLLEEKLIELKEKKISHQFTNISSKPILSFNRNFSAPIKTNFEQSQSDLLKLYAFDTDSFNRYEAGQKIMQKIIFDSIKSKEVHSPDFVHALQEILKDQKIDMAFKSDLLRITGEAELNDLLSIPDYDGVHHARESLLNSLALNLKNDLFKVYQELKNDTYDSSFKGVGRRALKNQCLYILSHIKDSEIEKLCMNQFEKADNMTDQISALKFMCNLETNLKDAALDSFYKQWSHERLVIDKWFAVQATSKLPGTLERVKKLLSHPEFTLKVPNRFRSLVNNFAVSNLYHFHQLDGTGYKFTADRVIEMDRLNPQVSARLVNYSFTAIKRLDPIRKELASKELKRILDSGNLSKDTFEIVSKNLGE
jgi:aminopeptidase N